MRARLDGPSTGLSRVKVVVVVLGVAIVVSLLARIGWVSYQDSQRRAALATPVPTALTATSSAPTTAPVTNGSSAPAATSQRPTTPVTTPTHPAAVVMPIIPNHIFIPAIGVNTTTSPAPTVMEWDQYVQKEVAGFGVPPETKEGLLQTTWWSDGPKPGSTGMAIVLGHSNVGIFDNIGRLKAGQLVGLTDGHALDTFRVIGVPRTGIPKTDGSALQRALLVHPTTARLALVTCSGAFNGSSSGENTVVYLELVSAKVVGK